MKRAAKKNQSAKKNRDRLMNDISANTDKHIKDVLRHRQTERQTDRFLYQWWSYFIKQKVIYTCDGGEPNRNRLFLNSQTFKSYSGSLKDNQPLEIKCSDVSSVTVCAEEDYVRQSYTCGIKTQSDFESVKLLFFHFRIILTYIILDNRLILISEVELKQCLGNICDWLNNSVF